MLYLFVLRQIIGRNPAKHRPKSSEKIPKPSNKLSRIDRYEHVERSMRVFISTVMNMWNGRYETNFSRVSPDFFKAFAPNNRGINITMP